MTAAVGKMLKSSTNSCESDWDQFWDDLFSTANQNINIAHDICEVAEPIYAGVELLSAGTATEVCMADSLIEEAEVVVKAVNEGLDCANLKYGVKQFVNYYD